MRWGLLAVMACSQRDAPPAPAPPAPIPARVVETPTIVDAALPDADIHHTLLAEQGTLAIAPVSGHVDAALVASLIVTPGAGYRINTDLKPTLELATPVAVVPGPETLVRWDREQLRFAISMRSREAGDYELHGTLHFAVCKAEACFPKDQPVAIALAVH